MGVYLQVQAFILTMALGVLAGLILHYYQVLIRKLSMGKPWLYMLDISIWILMIVIVFISMLYINQGEMRVYVLLALVLGVLAYYQLLCARFQKGLEKTADLNIKILKKLVKNPVQGVGVFMKSLPGRLHPGRKHDKNKN